MTRRGQWQKTKGWEKGGSWSYWPGSWKPRTPKKDTAGSLTTYDAVTIESSQGSKAANHAGPTPTKQTEPSYIGHGDLIRTMQAAVTRGRKANTKAQKLKNEMCVREKKWEAFQAEMREKFITQRAQFEADMEHLAEELREANDVSAKAEEEMRQIAVKGLHGLQDMETGPESTETSRAHALAWEELVKSSAAGNASMETDMVASAYLHQAMIAAQEDARVAKAQLAALQAAKSAPSWDPRKPEISQPLHPQACYWEAQLRIQHLVMARLLTTRTSLPLLQRR